MIGAGGVYVNNQRVTDVDITLDSNMLAVGMVMVVRKGRKDYRLIHFDASREG